MNFLFVFLFIGLAAKNNSIDAATFRFPNQNEFKKDCILGNDSFPVGLCKKAKHCTSFSTSKKELNTCFFDRFEQFVCCDRNAVDKSYSTNDRKALKACGTYYPVWLEVTHALPTRPREFPYMCALGWQSRFNRNTFDYKCGGVLIESNFVITAAHCAYVNGIAPVVVLPGGPNLTDSSARNYKIARIFVHPEYNPDSSYHDIAIIQTEELIDETKACLWSKFDLLTNTLTIVGYGDTKFAGQSSPQLLKAELQAISNQECGEFYEADFSRVNGIIKRQLCAKDPEALRDTCQGDSGGPLIMMEEINSKLIPQIVGVTSFGQGCAGGPPGVYTRISEYIDWIESIVWPSD